MLVRFGSDSICRLPSALGLTHSEECAEPWRSMRNRFRGTIVAWLVAWAKCSEHSKLLWLGVRATSPGRRSGRAKRDKIHTSNSWQRRFRRIVGGSMVLLGSFGASPYGAARVVLVFAWLVGTIGIIVIGLRSGKTIASPDQVWCLRFHRIRPPSDRFWTLDCAPSTAEVHPIDRQASQTTWPRLLHMRDHNRIAPLF